MVNHTLTVYPNPCHDNLTLNTEANDVVMLFNMQGALLLREVATDSQTTLNMQELPAGMYIVRCGSQCAKVVKR
jgi:heme/copper-type cytochrome/quinol oxidase subunit 2